MESIKPKYSLILSNVIFSKISSSIGFPISMKNKPAADNFYRRAGLVFKFA